MEWFVVVRVTEDLRFRSHWILKNKLAQSAIFTSLYSAHITCRLVMLGERVTLACCLLGTPNKLTMAADIGVSPSVDTWLHTTTNYGLKTNEIIKPKMLCPRKELPSQFIVRCRPHVKRPELYRLVGTPSFTSCKSWEGWNAIADVVVGFSEHCKINVGLGWQPPNNLNLQQ